MSSLWEYRGLIKKIALTDLKIRYKNSILGLAWSLLQPLMMFIVLFIVFSSLFKNNGIENYPLFLLLGIILWGFFEKATSYSLQSIVGKPTLVKKIYFPREVLVISACLTAFMMTMLEFIVFFIFLSGYLLIGIPIQMSWIMLLIPFVLAIEFVFVLGVSLAVASLNVRFRDIQYIWGVFMQAAFFLTPIMYSLKSLGEGPYVSLLRFNPMAIVLNSGRDILIYNTLPAVTDLCIIIFISALFLIVGGLIFRWLEPSFAEEV